MTYRAGLSVKVMAEKEGKRIDLMKEVCLLAVLIIT